jgi:hypothetical protein
VEAAAKHADLLAVQTTDMKKQLSMTEAIVRASRSELNDIKEDSCSQTRQLMDVMSYLQNSEELRQAQAIELESIKEDQKFGEVTLCWHANVNKARSSSKQYDNSKDFSVFVPGAGEYKCFLQIGVEEGNCIGFYNIVTKGPVFPVLVGVKVSCRAHSSQYVQNSMQSKDAFGFPRFMSDKQISSSKSASGHITINATIRLKCTGVLSL